VSVYCCLPYLMAFVCKKKKKKGSVVRGGHL
jgi:hypothetical protein